MNAISAMLFLIAGLMLTAAAFGFGVRGAGNIVDLTRRRHWRLWLALTGNAVPFIIGAIGAAYFWANIRLLGKLGLLEALITINK